jgi:site-specific recombinase XerD
MAFLSNQRKYLTSDEVEKLIEAAKIGEHGFRNATMIFVAYRHGLRVSELVNLEWNQIDLKSASIHVARLKTGTSTSHPPTGKELRSLKRLRRENPHARHVFFSERGSPMSRRNFNMLLKVLGEEAGIEVPVKPHSLRHACGFKLANQGTDTRTIQHFLGHKSIASTVVYTALDANRFNGLWRD